MVEKSSDSNVWLSRRRRDGRTGVAEPCSAQLRIDAPEARQPLINEVLCLDKLTMERLSGKDALACFLDSYPVGGAYVNPKRKAAAR